MTTIVRLKSNRAPYRRAGVPFPSRNKAVEIDRSDLTAAQLERLAGDGAITVELVDTETGVVTSYADHLAALEAATTDKPPAQSTGAEGDAAGASASVAEPKAPDADAEKPPRKGAKAKAPDAAE